MVKETNENNNGIDWWITIIPLVLISAISLLIVLYPEASTKILVQVKYLLCDKCGKYYLALGLSVFLISVFLSVSKYGNIILGEQGEKPKYSFAAWGSMMFTCGLAADILLYAFSEWIMYADNPRIHELGKMEDWASVYPIFHWGFIPWGFYLVLAVAFGYMLNNKKTDRQRLSEACRPVLHKYSNGIVGETIDIFAVFALLAGTATTFCIATPLMSQIIKELFGVGADRKIITIGILVITCIIYTCALLKEMSGISCLANICLILFWGIIGYIFFCGGQMRFITSTGVRAFGRMITHFLELSTYSDPEGLNHFPQDWTIYYWAYWMVWCVAAPFFIGKISRGRTIRQTILGGYFFGVGSTVLCFSICGNYSLGQQSSGVANYLKDFAEGTDVYVIIINIIHTLPGAKIVLGIILITMILFYATSFDSIAYIASCYSYKELNNERKPGWRIELMWCILLIMLPASLVFSENSMSNLQTVSIVAAFPLGMIMLLIIVSFFVDVNRTK